MKKRQKRVMAINDISCFGKCSLTVALPILSAAGCEACPIPTALLSTHTGGFDGYTFKNLDDQIVPICEHWKKHNIGFDAIYSGYLGSFKQLELVKRMIDDFSGENIKVLVDPVMGDNGRLYAGFSEEFSEGMLELCKKADIIVPNITEASYMLKLEYKEIYNEAEICDILNKFMQIGIKNIVITGIHMEGDIIASAVCEAGEMTFHKRGMIGGMYHGTGDVFASALLSAVLSGKDLKSATDVAVDFVCRSIEVTRERYGNSRYGVDFEDELPWLINALK